MDELINRQEAIGCLDDQITVTGEQNAIEIQNYIRRVANRLNELPSVQPRKGKWMPDNTNYYDERYNCSECNANYKVDTCMGKPSWNFCPNCGCRMEEGESDDN